MNLHHIMTLNDQLITIVEINLFGSNLNVDSTVGSIVGSVVGRLAHNIIKFANFIVNDSIENVNCN